MKQFYASRFMRYPGGGTFFAAIPNPRANRKHPPQFPQKTPAWGIDTSPEFRVPSSLRYFRTINTTFPGKRLFANHATPVQEGAGESYCFDGISQTTHPASCNRPPAAGGFYQPLRG